MQHLARSCNAIVFKDISRFTHEAHNGYDKYMPLIKRFVKCFFVFIDIIIILEYDLYNKSYFGGE